MNQVRSLNCLRQHIFYRQNSALRLKLTHELQLETNQPAWLVHLELLAEEVTCDVIEKFQNPSLQTANKQTEQTKLFTSYFLQTKQCPNIEIDCIAEIPASRQDFFL